MKCPDCGAELNTVVVERFQTKTFVVDHEKRQIGPGGFTPPDWWDEPNDYAYHCPECDSLNVDSALKQYQFVQGLCTQTIR